MNRVSNWDFWLVKVALAAEGKDFEWGYSDCATLARKCLITIFGTDLWDGHIGHWTTEKGALRAFSKMDVDQVLKNTGASEIGKNFATAGDLAISPNRDTHQLIQIAMILPTHKVLTSSMNDGVEILDAKFAEDIRFWRYVW